MKHAGGHVTQARILVTTIFMPPESHGGLLVTAHCFCRETTSFGPLLLSILDKPVG